MCSACSAASCGCVRNGWHNLLLLLHLCWMPLQQAGHLSSPGTHLQRQYAPCAGAVEVLLHHKPRHIRTRRRRRGAATSQHGVVESLPPLLILLVPASVKTCVNESGIQT